MAIPRKPRGHGATGSVTGSYTRYASDPRADIDPSRGHGDLDWNITPGGGYLRGNEYWPPLATYDNMIDRDEWNGPLNVEQFGATGGDSAAASE